VGIKILLADDSVTAQNMGKKILSEAGHEVITVNNGAAAAKKIAETKPELVLLDVFMPGYSGLELCEKLRNSPDTSKLPVLLTVGRMEPYSPQDGARVKADGVIIKPFEASDLTAAVERLAEKMRSGKPAAAERSAKATPAVAEKEEKQRDTQEIPPYEGSAPPKGYEQTIRLDAAQIAAMLNSTTATSEKAASAPDPAYRGATAAFPEELQVASEARSADIAAADGNAPVLGAELTSEARVTEQRPAAMPSYMAQFLTAEPAPPEPHASATPHDFVDRAVVAPPPPPAASEASALPSAPRQFSPTVPIPDDLLVERFQGKIPEEPAVASAEGLEFTAAAPVPDVPIMREPGFEPTLQSSETPTIQIKDPALVMDPHRATMDFTTQFGDTESALPPLPHVEETAAAIDDFEARLNSAMSNYDLPAADAPLSSTVPASPLAETDNTDLRAELFGEPSSPSSQSLEAPVESLPDLELPPGSFIGAPIEYAEPTAVTPELTIEETAEPAKSNIIEFHSRTNEAPAFQGAAFDASSESDIEIIPSGEDSSAVDLSQAGMGQVIPEQPATVDAVSSVVTPQSAEETPAPEADEAVIERIRQAFSGVPADHAQPADYAEPAPLAMAAAAGAATMPTQFPDRAELEIARALAAAVDSEAPSQPVASVAPQAEEAGFASDANKLAVAVERVMKRELPSLIWKIMAELDLRKR
jgi:CheY-like chemotaxis protein